MEIKTVNDLKTWLIQEPLLIGYASTYLYFISMRDRNFYGLLIEVSGEEREGELVKKTDSGLYLYQKDQKIAKQKYKYYDSELFAAILRKFKFSEDEMNRPSSMIGDIIDYKEKINEEKLISDMHQKYKLRGLIR